MNTNFIESCEKRARARARASERVSERKKTKRERERERDREGKECDTHASTIGSTPTPPLSCVENAITVVVPPAAAARVAVVQSPAILPPDEDGCAMWQCESTPPAHAGQCVHGRVTQDDVS